MLTLDRLIDQTRFLLEKQKQYHQFCADEFEGFLALTKEKQRAFGQGAAAGDNEKLQTIYDAVKLYAERFNGEIAGDIEFLGNQLEALEQIEAEKDPEKKEELIKGVMEEVEDDVAQQDFSQFKHEIEEEVSASQKELASVITDIKQALQEENFDDLLVYCQELEESASEEVDVDPSIQLEFEEEQEVTGRGGETCCRTRDEGHEKSKSSCCGGEGDCGDSCNCKKKCN